MIVLPLMNTICHLHKLSIFKGKWSLLRPCLDRVLLKHLRYLKWVKYLFRVHLKSKVAGLLWVVLHFAVPHTR